MAGTECVGDGRRLGVFIWSETGGCLSCQRLACSGASTSFLTTDRLAHQTPLWICLKPGWRCNPNYACVSLCHSRRFRQKKEKEGEMETVKKIKRMLPGSGFYWECADALCKHRSSFSPTVQVGIIKKRMFWRLDFVFDRRLYLFPFHKWCSHTVLKKVKVM